MSSHHEMSHADAAWLHMDRPTNLMIITSVFWFDEPIDRDRVRAVLEKRLVWRYDRFRQLAVESRLPLRGPHWEDDPSFDINRHMHHAALPAPGGEAGLREFVSDLASRPLDRAKPLWDIWFVDGFGGGSAIVTRMHHCIADGIALARVMLSLTDERPDAGIAAAPYERPPRRNLRDAAGPVAAAPRAMARLAYEGADTLLHPRRMPELAREAVRDATALRKLLLMSPDADTVFRGELTGIRRVAWTSELDLNEVKEICRAAGGTVNDVLVTALTGALRDYLRRHHSLTDEMRAIVPFNLRPLDKPLPATLGNDFGLVYLPLPVGLRSARARLAAVKRGMDEIKDSAEGPVAYGVLSLIGLTPLEVEKLAVSLFSAKGSAVVTNVPGPRRPVYLAGTPVRGVLVWAPTSGSVSMSVSVMSYAGRVTVGVMSDAGLVADPERIARAVERELTRLRRLYLEPAPAPRRPRRAAASANRQAAPGGPAPA